MSVRDGSSPPQYWLPKTLAVSKSLHLETVSILENRMTILTHVKLLCICSYSEFNFHYRIYSFRSPYVILIKNECHICKLI